MICSFIQADSWQVSKSETFNIGVSENVAEAGEISREILGCTGTFYSLL
jgi:hypothetical protein